MKAEQIFVLKLKITADHNTGKLHFQLSRRVIGFDKVYLARSAPY